jgi:hypothetical protein
MISEKTVVVVNALGVTGARRGALYGRVGRASRRTVLSATCISIRKKIGQK